VSGVLVAILLPPALRLRQNTNLVQADQTYGCLRSLIPQSHSPTIGVSERRGSCGIIG
jgi:hypothetical protein